MGHPNQYRSGDANRRRIREASSLARQSGELDAQRARRASNRLVKAELEKLISVSLKDEGCIQYDMHRDNENPAFFLFYENWASRELWQAHMKTPHLSAYRLATEGAVAEFTLHEMTRVALP